MFCSPTLFSKKKKNAIDGLRCSSTIEKGFMRANASYHEWRPAAYFSDYIVLAVLLVSLGVLFFFRTPIVRDFNPNDPLIQNKYHPSTVSDSAALILASAIPALIFVLAFVARRSKLELHNALLGLVLALLLMLVNFEWMKQTFGELRPDFAARCKWDPATQNCTGDLLEILEGRKSFPSGHAGIMFTTYSYAILWICGRFKPWRRGFLPVVLLLNILFSLSLWVLATRIIDNKHHPWDVAFGAFFGVVIGVFSYMMYFNSPFGLKAGQPKGRKFDSWKNTILKSMDDDDDEEELVAQPQQSSAQEQV